MSRTIPPPWEDYECEQIDQLKARIAMLDNEIELQKRARTESFERFAKLRTVVRRQQDAAQANREERGEEILSNGHWTVVQLQRMLEVKK